MKPETLRVVYPCLPNRECAAIPHGGRFVRHKLIAIFRAPYWPSSPSALLRTETTGILTVLPDARNAADLPDMQGTVHAPYVKETSLFLAY
jgi:hypothetical protein